MRIDRVGHAGIPVSVVEITLSERNLRSLLVKLGGHPTESACTIVRQAEAGGPTLIVHAEADDVHYTDRPPGPMHPDTEDALV